MVNELQQEIDAYLESHWDEIVEDIASLVRVESMEHLGAAAENAPYGPGPREALSRALSIAERMGLSAHDCEGRIGFADLRGASDTQIGIIGHVDVVPAGPGWAVEPYEVTRKDGYLLGRGVIDDKGPILVALHAVKFWKDRAEARGNQLPYTVRVLFGANEETNMKDVGYYREHFDDPAFLFTPDNQFPVGYAESGICSGTLESGVFSDRDILMISGGQAVNAVPGQAGATVRAKPAYWAQPEPAGIHVFQVPGSNGEQLQIDVQGVSAHASAPELGVNAIGMLVDYLLDVGVESPDERLFLELLQRIHAHSDGSSLGIACADEHFGPLSVVGGVIRVKDGRLRQSLDFRYPTSITSEQIERRVADLAVAEGGAGASFTMEHDKKPFVMDCDSPAVRALIDAYCLVTGESAKAMASKGGTYARCFTTGVSFGVEKPWEPTPDWVGSMHGPNEGVSEDLLKQSFAIYAHALGNLMQVAL